MLFKLLTSSSITSIPQKHKPQQSIPNHETQHHEQVIPFLRLLQTLLHQKLIPINQALTPNALQAFHLPFIATKLIDHKALKRVLEQTQVLHESAPLRYRIPRQKVAREQEERARYAVYHGHTGDVIRHQSGKACDERVCR